MSYSYLASPYTHPQLYVELERYHAAERAAVWLLQRKVWVYSPIVHCHPLALKYKLPTDYDFWRQYNQAMIMSAYDLIVLALDGWANSKGVKDEIKLATQLGLQVFLMEPNSDGYKVSIPAERPFVECPHCHEQVSETRCTEKTSKNCYHYIRRT